MNSSGSKPCPRQRRGFSSGRHISVLVAAIAMLAGNATVQAQMVPFDCSPTAFLIQANDALGVDLVTGEVETLAADFHNSNINGFGYNILDDFIYGWDADEIVRVDSNWNVDGLGVPPGTSRSVIGDVDENGHFWFLTGGNWFQVDLEPGSVTYFEVLAQGSVAGGGIEDFGFGNDWAYVPNGGDSLYRVMRDGSTTPATSVLFRFDRTHKTWHNLGNLGELGGNSFGAVYSDAAGFLYAADNDSGNIYRINVQAATADLFASGPPSSTNDGGRCFAAEVLIDFGDAPDSYGTLLASDGARHGILDYDAGSNTSPLMLGARISPSNDGQPSPAADAGAFEDGVSGQIRYRNGQNTVVTVTATNNTDEDATLVGWMDLGLTGVFTDDPPESVIVPANSGADTYELTFPPVGFSDGSNTYLRLRLFPGMVGSPSPLGPASAGEVEDYLVRQHRPPTGVPIDTPWMLVLLAGLFALIGGRISQRHTGSE